MSTLKQRIAIEKISEFIRKNPKQKSVSLGKLLTESGYSDSVARSPQRVTESKGFQELLEETFPEKELLNIHKKLLKKEEVFTYKGQIIKTGQPHSDVKYALDMVYKLKKENPATEKETTLYDLDNLTNEELDLLDTLTQKMSASTL